jgi:hypothetical protein
MDGTGHLSSENEVVFVRRQPVRLSGKERRMGLKLHISSWRLLIASSWRWNGRNVQMYCLFRFVNGVSSFCFLHYLFIWFLKDSRVTDLLLFFSRWLSWAITWPFKLLHSLFSAGCLLTSIITRNVRWPYSTSLSSLEPLSFPVYKHYHREINSVGVGPAIRAFT